MGRRVFVAENETEAQIVRDLLAQRGIDVEISGAWRAALRGMLPLAETSIAIEVSEEDEARARAALAELVASQPSTEVWICPRCAEEVPSNFEACWHCGGAAGGRSIPVSEPADRGDLPRSRLEPLEELLPRAPTMAHPGRDLLIAIGAGCLPAALTGLWAARPGLHLTGLTPAGEAGLLNLVVGVEMLVCLSLLRRGGGAPAPWADRTRWLGDLVGGLMLGALLFVVGLYIYGTLRRLGAPAPSSVGATSGPYPSSTIRLDIGLLLVPGVCLAAAAGALLLYGIILDRLRFVLRSPVAALLVTTLIATFTWHPGGGLAITGTVLARQLVIGAAFLLLGRAWPVAVASAFSYLLTWLPALLRG